MIPDTFYQDPYHAWHFRSLKPDVDITALPLGTEFYAMNPPGAGNLKRWSIAHFRVAMRYNFVRQRRERVYVVLATEEFDSLPDVCVVWHPNHEE